MKINFFEEFPKRKNLEKVKLIDFESTIYIAARSIDEFKKLKEKVKILNPKLRVAYWPILEKSYWISPFSYNYELNKLYEDLEKNKKGEKLKILIDLELPFLNKKLFFKNLSFFFKNKKIIRKIFSQQNKLNIEILTAEYPVPGRFFQKILNFLGISYSINKYPHKRIIMFYTSMFKEEKNSKFRKHIKKRKEELGDKLQVGLGTIAIGILGDEPKLSPANLERDLSFCKNNSIKDVVIFRLGGLNKEYLNKLKKFTD